MGPASRVQARASLTNYICYSATHTHMCHAQAVHVLSAVYSPERPDAPGGHRQVSWGEVKGDLGPC